MRIVVMGAGGTGGYFGAKLARAGEDVTLVARGAHAEAIRASGLRVKSALDGEWTVHAPVVERLEGRPPADLVLFCVKAYDTTAAAALIRPVVGPATGVLSIQNGVDNVDALDRLLGPRHVLGGVARVFTTIGAPGLIVHTLLGQIVFGEMDGAVTPRAQALLEACRRAGIPAEISSDIRRALWEKYVFIVAQSGLTALTRCPAGVIRRVAETRALYREVLVEMVSLARAAGIGLDETTVDGVMAQLDAQGGSALSSLYHDLVHGRRLELETLQGHAVRLGERHGLAIPAVRAVYAALKPHVDGPPVPVEG